MAQTLDAAAIRRHLEGKTVLELCDDYAHLVNSSRRIKWAEEAISRELGNRDEVAWFEWMLEGNPFGPVMPHKFFMPR